MHVDIVLTRLYCLYHLKKKRKTLPKYCWGRIIQRGRTSPTSNITPLTKLFYLLIFLFYSLPHFQLEGKCQEERGIFFCLFTVLLFVVNKSCPVLLWPSWTVAHQAPLHGTSEARILEWVAIYFSRGYSWPRDRTCISCTAGRFFTTEPPGKPLTALYPAL